MKELTPEVQQEIDEKVMRDDDFLKKLRAGEYGDYSEYEGIGQYVQTLLNTYDWAFI